MGVYKQQYGEELDYHAHGHTTAFDASTAFLWEVSRTVSRSDPSNPVLGVDDEIALTPAANKMASWPSLYRALCMMAARKDGGLPLSALPVLLRHGWHSDFDESKLYFYNDSGASERIPSLQHMVLLLIDWHDQWMRWHRSEARSTRLEELLSTSLQLVPGTNGDCLLKVLLPGEVPDADRLLLVRRESRSKAWAATAKSEPDLKGKAFSGATVSGLSPGCTSVVNGCIPVGIVQRYKSQIESA